MRRPSSAPESRPAPPPRRSGSPGPPPRRSSPSGPEAGAGSRTAAPPRATRPGPRPAPARPAGPPRRRRRGPILIALGLTLLILLGYGAYTGWHTIRGGGSDDTTAPTGAGGFDDIVNRDLFIAGAVVGQGVDVRLVSELQPFLDETNRNLFILGSDIAELGKLAQTATSAQRDVIAATQQSQDALRVALIQWRDAVSNLRLASVDDAHAAVDDAVAQLRADLERWKSVAPSS